MNNTYINTILPYDNIIYIYNHGTILLCTVFVHTQKWTEHPLGDTREQCCSFKFVSWQIYMHAQLGVDMHPFQRKRRRRRNYVQNKKTG